MCGDRNRRGGDRARVAMAELARFQLDQCADVRAMRDAAAVGRYVLLSVSAR